MASLEITAEELSTIDTNQVAQINLKDGTVIVVNGGAEAQEAQAEEEFVQEEQAQEVPQEEQAQEVQAEENVEGQENQLRARPYMGRMVPPMRPVVAPMRPLIPPRPLIHPVPMRQNQ